MVEAHQATILEQQCQIDQRDQALTERELELQQLTEEAKRY